MPGISCFGATAYALRTYGGYYHPPVYIAAVYLHKHTTLKGGELGSEDHKRQRVAAGSPLCLWEMQMQKGIMKVF